MLRFFAFFSLLLVVGCRVPSQNGISRELFHNPPHDAGLHAYWQWIDGYVSREGITGDLEAMKEQGITQAVILCVSMFDGKDLEGDKVTFASEEWFELFQWTLKEAHRLGISIGVHNSNGWSGSGGPWITPEMSMKKYTWTSTLIEGNQQVAVQLRKPRGVRNFYRDAAVIAVRTEKNTGKKVPKNYRLNGQTDAGALNDGSPVSHLELNKGDTISITAENEFSFSKIAVTPYHSSMWGEVETFEYILEVLVRSNNSSYKTLANVTIDGVNKVFVVNLPETTTREVLVVISSAKNKHYQVPANMGEIELLNTGEEPLYYPRIPDFLEKAAFTRSKQEQYFSRLTNFNSLKTQNENKLAEVIDLSEKMDSTGFLQWEVPDGNWEIFRFGYTTTGAVSNPVPAVESGLECDKMDTSALNVHFRNFPEKLIQTAEKYTGNTFKYLLSDSYECSYTNWTSAFPEEFKKRTGYPIYPWIPVLCGYSAENQHEAESFLYDFRKVIASLIEENYYRHLQTLCHRNKLEFHAEMIYGNYSYPPLEIIRANQYADLPMTEFWTHSDTNSFLQFIPVSQREIHFPVSSSRIYEIPVVGAEAYTGLAHFSESLNDLKPFADRAFCEGINQFVLHSIVHQPDDRKPGFTLGRYASHFNRHNLYWPAIKEWGKYHARIQYVLQKGTTVADVLYFPGDQLPQFNYPNKSTDIPLSHHLTAINADALNNRITIENNKLVLNKKDSARLLVFPPHGFMNLETLKRLQELVAAGAYVYAAKPENPLMLSERKNNIKEFHQITGKLWGEGDGVSEKQYGEGKIFNQMPVGEVLRKNIPVPDFSHTSKNPLALNFIHKKIGLTDVYFVANQLDSTFYTELKFRISGKVPQVWDPVDGSVYMIGNYKCDNKQTTVSFGFKPYQSLFFVFMPENEHENPVESFPKPDKEIQITDLAGEIEFTAPYPVNIPQQPFHNLSPLTESENPEIKYFAGDMCYKTRFMCPGELLLSSRRMYLDIGRFDGIARVKLNGKVLQTLWYIHHKLDVTGLLMAENELEVTITNTWRNRIIGKFSEYGIMHNIWTSAPVEEFLDQGKPLKPSGWFGPLKLNVVYRQK